MPKPEVAGLPEPPSTSLTRLHKQKALSFIHVTEPGESRESRTRKVVRSHALRDYHRNKRIASVREHAAAQKLATDAQHYAKTFPGRLEQLVWWHAVSGRLKMQKHILPKINFGAVLVQIDF